MGNRMLSELPDDVIHRIITHHFLGDPDVTNKTAVQLGRLSKDLWSAVQSRRPALFFEWNDDDPARCLQELEYMVHVLKQDTHLETFKIKIPHFSSSISEEAEPGIDGCIKLAAATSPVLKDLYLDLWYSYVLPQPVFRVESLVHLDLEGGRLEPAAQSVVMWPNLKTLSLSIVHIGEGVIENIMRGCPLIETIKICFCHFNISNYHIKVSDLGYLRKLDVWSSENQTFEVDATPNLESIACYYFSVADFGEHEYHKVRSLSLRYPKALTDEFLTNMSSQFPRLEELSIHDMHTDIKRISISSSSLKKIKLSGIQGLEEATFDVPNLVRFEYGSIVVPKLSFAGNGSRGLVFRIRFHDISIANMNTSWFLKLKKFLATILNMHAISISICYTTFSIDAKPTQLMNLLIKYSDSISYTVDKFEFRTRGLDKQVLSSEILDTILLTFQPKKILLRDCSDCKFPEIVYDNLITLKVFHDPKSMWSVTKIGMNVWLTKIVNGSTKYRFLDKDLNEPGAVDIDKFVELFRVDHGDWKPEFFIDFHFDYSLMTKDDAAKPQPVVKSVKGCCTKVVRLEGKHLKQQPMDKFSVDEILDQPKDVVQHQLVVQVKSVNEGTSTRKFSGCCAFRFPSVKWLLFH